MRKARLLVLVVLWGCGSNGPSAETAGGSPVLDASAEASLRTGAVFQDILPQVTVLADAGTIVNWAQCPDASLPVGDAGLPNCVVVSARMPYSEDDFKACQRCDAPGLEPFVAPVPLDSIGEGLSNYSCLCAVKPLPPSQPFCSFPDTTTASWCYSGASEPPCGSKPGPTLLFSQGALVSGTLYVACFDQPAVP
jgi:hypothetical protein